VTGGRYAKPTQPAAMQDPQLRAWIEKLGAVDRILEVGMRLRSPGMLGVVYRGAHEAICAPVVDDSVDPACSAAGGRSSADAAAGGGVAVWAPIKPSRRTPVAIVLTRSSRMTMAPGSRRRQGRVDLIG
jgi:hypothetical protein